MKPNVVWLEGVLDFFNAPFPHDPRDPRAIGFSVGRQVIALYLVEMLLKYALDSYGVPHGKKHDLHQLFMNLPRPTRRAVERRYAQLLRSAIPRTWDVCRTVESFLDYLGDNPITDTRYFWENDRECGDHRGSVLIMQHTILRQLVYAIFIELHNYPTKSIVDRYETEFESLDESFRENNDEPREQRRVTRTLGSPLPPALTRR